MEEGGEEVKNRKQNKTVWQQRSDSREEWWTGCWERRRGEDEKAQEWFTVVSWRYDSYFTVKCVAKDKEWEGIN